MKKFINRKQKFVIFGRIIHTDFFIKELKSRGYPKPTVIVSLDNEYFRDERLLGSYGLWSKLENLANDNFCDLYKLKSVNSKDCFEILNASKCNIAISINCRNIIKKELIDLSCKKGFLLMEDRKFFDISYIVEKQFNEFKEWMDLVTVHGMVNEEVLKKITCGVLLVSNMSNNNYDITDRCVELHKNNNNIIGLITQTNKRYKDLITFRPGISINNDIIDDQQYKNINEIKDMPDIVIVGRTIYNSKDILNTNKNINNKINLKFSQIAL